METNAATATHDLTTAADAAAAVLPILDVLAPGEAAELDLAPAGASAALKALQAERKGLFEWSVLGEGAPLRVQLLRRDEDAGTRRGVTEALGWDHDRLDAIEAAAFEARAAGSFAEAQALYAIFATGLKRHIAFEEDLLFPTFEERMGFPPHAGPTAVMRMEHRQIVELLARIANGIGAAGSGVEEARARIHAVLGDHNMKEEQILYPHTDRALGPDEADALVAAIQAY